MRNLGRVVRWAAVLVLVQICATPLEAGAGTYLGFTIGVNNAPPPPRVVVVDQPEVVLVPSTSVYVVENSDYDVFRYGGTYYCYNDGYWYRSRSASGTFVTLDVRSVPRAVLNVPSRHWKHHPHGGPPGQMKKGRY
jgi:hypothetical protein